MWRIESIAERLQAAALDPALWPTALDYIGTLIDGMGSVLFSTESHLVYPPASPGLQSAVEVYMRDGWNRQEQRYRGIPTMLRKGVMIDEDCISKAEMARSPFYQEFLRAQGVGPFAGVGFKAGDDLWVLSIMRHAGQRLFEGQDMQG